MNLSDLKQKSSQEILELAESMGLDDISRKRKQDLIFSILKAHAKGGEEISGDGTLELLQDGYGFLRAEVNSYQANPDDIYVHAGDKVTAGQQIALVGNTGNSTGCHLHFEVHVNGETTDPAPFMQERGVDLNGEPVGADGGLPGW